MTNVHSIISTYLSLLQQLQATRDNLSKRGEEAEKKLKEADSERKKQEKELKDAKQTITKQNKTLKELRGGVNVMLRSILNEVRNYMSFSINNLKC